MVTASGWASFTMRFGKIHSSISPRVVRQPARSDGLHSIACRHTWSTLETKPSRRALSLATPTSAAKSDTSLRTSPKAANGTRQTIPWCRALAMFRRQPFLTCASLCVRPRVLLLRYGSHG